MRIENKFIHDILQNRPFIHTLYWLFVLLIAPLSSSEDITEIGEALVYRGVAMPVKIIATYVLAYYQIPKLLQQKKYIQFVLSFVFSALIFSLLYRFNNVHIAETLMDESGPKESLWQMIQEIDYTFFGYFMRVYIFSLLFIFIKLIRSQTREQQEIELLQKEKAYAELNFLRAQIHPHFLFNTLNNLYALTIKKSDQAPEVVAKLSEILDYILYQSKESKVLINQEIELINNYIALEKLRYGNRLNLKFIHELEKPHAKVAPLILISVVENAFKHGASGSIKDVTIEIVLKQKDDRITFEVFNTKPQIMQKDDTNFKDGIGSENVKRQLELIYPDKYTWKVSDLPESYRVILTITE